MKKYFCDICKKEARMRPHDFQFAIHIAGKHFPVQANVYEHYSTNGFDCDAHFCEAHRKEVFNALSSPPRETP